jgi:hypothetical protein
MASGEPKNGALKRLAIVALSALALVAAGCGSSVKHGEASSCLYTEAGIHLCGGSAYAYCQQTGLREHHCEPVWLEHLKHGDAAEKAEASSTEAKNAVYEELSHRLEKADNEGK